MLTRRRWRGLRIALIRRILCSRPMLSRMEQSQAGRRNGTLVRWFVVVQAMTASTGCFPYYGYSSGPVVCNSVRFVDAHTKNTLPEVLVIPHATSSFGGGFFWRNDATPFLGLGVGGPHVAHPLLLWPVQCGLFNSVAQCPRITSERDIV